MKAVLISIRPYWVFLIIARLMGWNIPQEKTVEIRKDYPKASDWNRIVHIYCSKNRKSFNRIPKEYQPFMEKFLGRAMGEFVCDRIEEYEWQYWGDVRNAAAEYMYFPFGDDESKASCLSFDEIDAYGKGKKLYGWHISDLKIYDKPKWLGEFRKSCPFPAEDCDLYCPYALGEYHGDGINGDVEFIGCGNKLTRPPQSWCYIEELS